MSYKTPAGKDADIRKAAAKDSHMVLTEGSAKVYTEGKILYVTDGVEVTSDYSAVTPEGTGCIIFIVKWMDPQKAYKLVGEIARGKMKGRTMYVIPYSMGR